MHAEDLATYTRIALLAIARQQELRGVSRLRKKDLRDLLIWLLTAATTPSASELKGRIAAVNPRRRRKTLIQEAQELPSSPVSLAESPSALSIPDEQPPHPLETAEPQALPPTPATATPRQDAAESKFFLGAHATVPLVESETLPTSYDDNRVVLLVRDPHWLYAYWDFSETHFSNTQGQFGAMNDGLMLKLFDVTYIEFNGANAWSSTEIRLTPFATNWYIPVSQTDTAYCVEIGYYSRAGRFVALGRSNTITTPRTELVANADVQWFTPPELRPAAPQSGPAPRTPRAQEGRDGQKAMPWLPTPETAAEPPAPSPAEHPFSWGAEHRR
ncbi:MAG: DUF4912 domain-containing protein [Deltaproteobacteria bacterium]|nr:DUF4912 domain-containing protein [Deltaproteobacteria bacterium]